MTCPGCNRNRYCRHQQTPAAPLCMMNGRMDELWSDSDIDGWDLTAGRAACAYCFASLLHDFSCVLIFGPQK